MHSKKTLVENENLMTYKTGWNNGSMGKREDQVANDKNKIQLTNPGGKPRLKETTARGGTALTITLREANTVCKEQDARIS